LVALWEVVLVVLGAVLAAFFAALFWSERRSR
jgi:hypothetical protein